MATTYRETPAGIVQITEKEETKRDLGGRSPDEADVCAMAFSETGEDDWSGVEPCHLPLRSHSR